MYTVDEEKKDLYEDELNEAVYYENRKSIIFKIVIIILCIILLIWLISALKSNHNSSDNGQIHNANVAKMRLASEKYLFINNKAKKSYVDLYTLKNNNLIGDIVDANNKVCSTNKTNSKLTKENGQYKLTVALSCSTNDKEEVFYYHGDTLACLNCNGQTNMDGRNNPIDDKEDENGGNKNDSDNVPDDSSESRDFSCINWTPWSKDRIYDSSLIERTKTLVLGVKKGNPNPTVVYGDWSDYTTTPLTPSDTLEVETKVQEHSVWSNNKESNTPISESSTIRIISVENDNSVKVGNITFTDYHSGKYNILNDKCERVSTLQNSEGKYVLTYVNCQYTENNSQPTKYIYQELETVYTTLYRSRTITIVDNPTEDIYTDKKYEESELPEGFVKVEGSEETYYSYKLATCEK